MKITLAEPKFIKDSVSLISDLVNEARFQIGPDALEVVAMDPANVAMIVFKLLSSTFSEYDVKEPQIIGINMANFKQILRRAGPSDVLTLEMTDNSKLKITFKGTSTRTFSLPVLETGESDQKVPDLEFPVSVKLLSTSLNEAIEDADVVSEAVNLAVDPKAKKFIISAEGDLSDAMIEIPESEHTVIESSGTEILKSKYSIEYLKKMVGGSKLADDVTLKFNKDYPLRIDFTIVDKLQLMFILAPRVEND